MKHSAITLCISLLLISATVMAQDRPDPAVPQGANLEVPIGWEVRTDHDHENLIVGNTPDSADIYFVNMTPGWHITSGPAAIYYHPANTADGAYKIKADLYYFDPNGRNREGYGIIMGGKNLDNANQEYLYFLLRNTGEFLIKSRLGEETSEIQTWTAHDAIQVFDEDSEEASVRNELMAEVSESEIIFYVNGEEVSRVPKANLNTDGVFGLRVNHSVNMHISDLALME